MQKTGGVACAAYTPGSRHGGKRVGQKAILAQKAIPAGRLALAPSAALQHRTCLHAFLLTPNNTFGATHDGPWQTGPRALPSEAHADMENVDDKGNGKPLACQARYARAKLVNCPAQASVKVPSPFGMQGAAPAGHHSRRR